MSIESYSDDQPPSLSLDIPCTSSVDSSLASSPTGILSPTPSTSHTASTSSLTSKTGITFAPLPELAPRKRRSTTPLGIAARSQLVGRRRRGGGDFPSAAMAYQSGNPIWTDEELEKQRQLAMAEGRRRHYQHHYLYPDEEEEMEMEDPFLAFGKLVKGAGKSIWRKVSHKDLMKQERKEKEKEKGRGEEEKSKEAGETDENGGVEAVTPTSGAEPRHVLATITQNGEDVLESKDDDEEHFRTIGQTETIREGHTKYPWMTEAVDDIDTDDHTPVTQPEDHLP